MKLGLDIWSGAIPSPSTNTTASINGGMLIENTLCHQSASMPADVCGIIVGSRGGLASLHAAGAKPVIERALRLMLAVHQASIPT